MQTIQSLLKNLLFFMVQQSSMWKESNLTNRTDRQTWDKDPGIFMSGLLLKPTDQIILD